MTDHKVTSREEWLAAREALLVREKEHTRMGDDLARQRRELPWVRGEKEYSFETDEGMMTLAELFDGRSQLLVYHFMFGPSYEAGIPPVVDHLASASGTDIVGYLSEGPGFSTFVRDDDAVFHVYSTTARGLEFLMGYYPILDRAPNGRNEADSPIWLRRHDEYARRAT